MIAWLRRVFMSAVARFRPKRPEPQPEPQPVDDEPKPNRKIRRAARSQLRRELERKRKKFDKFVEPKGEPPRPVIHAEHTKREPGAADVPPPAPNWYDEHTIADVHHSDRKTVVLYEGDEFYGEFNFRDTILEQLDSYFVYLARMRRRDADAYGFYRNVGATLLPYISIGDLFDIDDESKGKPIKKAAELSPWFVQTRPAFGCFAYGANPEAEKLEEKAVGKKVRWIPKFMYFVKYTRPPSEIQPMSGGDVYKVTVWWDRPQDKKMDRKLKHSGVPEEFAIFVHRNGKMRALKTRRHSNGNVGKWHYWRLPGRDWAKQHNTDPQIFLTDLFAGLVSRGEYAAWSMIRVSVEKNGNYAMFSIDQKRAGYFFKDRDYDLTPSGLRKRIFHMVRPHVRKDGTAVPMSFRGQREFTWAGYNVKITIPGLHHKMLEENDLGVVDSEWQERGEQYVTEPKYGEMLRKRLNT